LIDKCAGAGENFVVCTIGSCVADQTYLGETTKQSRRYRTFRCYQ